MQINPAWQRVGLGRALMERLLGGLIDAGIPAITLYADPKVVTLYEKLGFARDPKVEPIPLEGHPGTSSTKWCFTSHTPPGEGSLVQWSVCTDVSQRHTLRQA